MSLFKKNLIAQCAQAKCDFEYMLNLYLNIFVFEAKNYELRFTATPSSHSYCSARAQQVSDKHTNWFKYSVKKYLGMQVCWRENSLKLTPKFKTVSLFSDLHHSPACIDVHQVVGSGLQAGFVNERDGYIYSGNSNKLEFQKTVKPFVFINQPNETTNMYTQ